MSSSNHSTLKSNLTGLYTREFLEEYITREIARVERHDRTLSIALVHIDQNHDISEEYGAKVYNQVLTHITSRINLVLRQSDSMVCLWSDNKLLICLLECDLRGASLVLERLRSRLSSEPIHALSHEIPITISAGIATHRPGIRMDSLIKEAQYALTQALQAGSNQVRCLEL